MDPSQSGQPPEHPQAPTEPSAPPQAPQPLGVQPGYPYYPGYAPYPVPQPKKRSRLLIVAISLIVVVAIAGVGLVAAGMLLANKDEGKVVVTKTQPASCVVDNQVTSVNVGDTIYIVGIFHDRVDSGTELTLEFIKDGTSILTTAPVAHKSVDCLWDQEPTNGWAAGSYTVKFRAAGVVQAEGSFDVKQP